MLNGPYKDLGLTAKQHKALMDRIGIELIPRKGNEEFLKYAAHVDVEDLSMIVRVFTICADGTEKQLLVSDDAIEMMGLDRDEFIHDAINAAELNHPAMLSPLNDVLGTSDDAVKTRAYVASNIEINNGASVIMYPDFFERSVKSVGESMWILPSSRHEVLLLEDRPGSFYDLSDLKAMVWNVNALYRYKTPDYYLSDNVYHWDVYDKKFEKGETFLRRIMNGPVLTHEPSNNYSVSMVPEFEKELPERSMELLAECSAELKEFEMRKNMDSYQPLM